MSQIKEPVKRDLYYWAPIHTKAADAVGDYYKAKLDAEKPRQRPLCDKARSSPLAELVVARRALESSARELAAKREYQATKRTEMDALWADLREKELQLKESFQNYNKFIKENHEKRERAEVKIKEEKAVQERRDAEIQEVKDRMNELERIKEVMERYITDYRMYEDFLVRVVNESSEFSSVHDILDRYETLSATRAELAARQDRDLAALESARHRLMALTEEKSKALMGLNNKLAKLWKRYDSTRMQDIQWETVLNRVKCKSSEKCREEEAVHMMCWNLYQLLCRCRSEPVELDRAEVEKQLLYIQHAIQQLRAIHKLAKRNIAREAASMPSNTLPELSGIPTNAPRIVIT